MPHSCMKDSWHGWEGLAEGRGYVSDFHQMPIQDETSPSSDNLLSEPGLHNRPPLGSKISLTPRCRVRAEAPFICGIAHFSSPPETERVKLCTLAFVQNSLLPVQRRAVVCHIPCRRPDPAVTACQKQKCPWKHFSRNKEIRHPDEQDLGKESSRLMGFRTLMSPVEESSEIKQAAGKESITSQKKDLQPSQAGPCQEWEEASRSSPLFSDRMRLDEPVCKSPTLLSANCPLLERQSSGRSMGGNAQPAELEPAGTEAKIGFSSITIISRRVPQKADAALQESPSLDPTTLLDGGQPCPAPGSPPSTGEPTPTDCNGQPFTDKKKASSTKMINYRQSFLSAHRAAEFRHSFTEGGNKCIPAGSCGSLAASSDRGPFRSCAHLEVPARHAKSFLHLTRALSLPITESCLDDKATRPDIHRSTLYLHLQSNSIHRAAANSRTVLRSDTSARPGRPLSCSGVLGDLALDPDNAILPLAQSRLPICICSTDPDFSTHISSSELPLGNLSDSSPQDAKRAGIANEDPCLCRRRTGGLQAAIGTTEVVDAGSHRRTSHLEAGARQGGPHGAKNTGLVSRSRSLRRVELCQPWLPAAPKNPTLDGLTLREALELFRPEFISRSQDRVKQLEQRAQERRNSQSRAPVQETPRGQRRRNCTKPHPLSDNLYKPRERAISGKEMQRRSKRIYENLPEVTKKKEEEKKKAVSEINRLKAELFKKKVLHQILQRNGD